MSARRGKDKGVPSVRPLTLAFSAERGSKRCHMTWHQGYLFQSKPRSIPTPAAMSTDCSGLLRILSSRPSSS